MNKDVIVTGVLIEEISTASLSEVCHQYNIPEELFIEMMEYGLFNNQSADLKQIALNQKTRHRIESAYRLHKDLEINLQGIAVVLELMEEMETIRNELEILRKHF